MGTAHGGAARCRGVRTRRHGSGTQPFEALSVDQPPSLGGGGRVIPVEQPPLGNDGGKWGEMGNNGGKWGQIGGNGGRWGQTGEMGGGKVLGKWAKMEENVERGKLAIAQYTHPLCPISTENQHFPSFWGWPSPFSHSPISPQFFHSFPIFLNSDPVQALDREGRAAGASDTPDEIVGLGGKDEVIDRHVGGRFVSPGFLRLPLNGVPTWGPSSLPLSLPEAEETLLVVTSCECVAALETDGVRTSHPPPSPRPSLRSPAFSITILQYSLWMGIGCKALSRFSEMVALPRRWVVANFRPRSLPETSTSASGTVVFPRPEAAGCNPRLCRRLSDAWATSRRRLPDANRSLPGSSLNSDQDSESHALVLGHLTIEL